MPAALPHPSFVCVPSVRVVCALFALSVPVTARDMTPGKSETSMAGNRRKNFMADLRCKAPRGVEDESGPSGYR